MRFTTDTGVNICREIEKKIKPLGYHCGLTGSTLYKGTSIKDIDIIIYPHNIAYQLPIERIITKIGLQTDMYPNGGMASDLVPSTTDKLVIVGLYKNKRVDLFFLK